MDAAILPPQDPPSDREELNRIWAKVLADVDLILQEYHDLFVGLG